MTTSDPLAKADRQILTQLSELEARVEMIHEELRQTTTTVIRLKLMADNAKDREKEHLVSLKKIESSISHIETLLKYNP